METGISRGGLLARGGAALLAGSSLGALAGAARAGTPPVGDLAYARLFVASELLALDFYRQAIVSKQFAGADLRNLWLARADEREHYRSAAQILIDAGQVPATAGDIDFTYPGGSFASRRAIAGLGTRLEALFVAAYLGAVGGYQTEALKELAARAAASEARHLSVFAGEVGGRRVGPAFPRPLPIDKVSDVLDRYTS
jgi:hypothetical protein